VMDEPDFQSGDFDIRYLDRHPDILADAGHDDDTLRAMAVAAALLEEDRRTRRSAARVTGGGEASVSRWKRAAGWRR
jgi:hypothetical protein